MLFDVASWWVLDVCWTKESSRGNCSFKVGRASILDYFEFKFYPIGRNTLFDPFYARFVSLGNETPFEEILFYFCRRLGKNPPPFEIPLVFPVVLEPY